MIGNKIKNPFKIVDLALKKKCVVIVYGNGMKSRQPCAFIQNYQFHYLMMLIKRGVIYEYKK